MAGHMTPSPSPPPSAPIPSAPTPGPRAVALDKIYTSALKSTLKSNSYSNFAACFPTPAKYCPTALEGVWRQLNTRLEEECLKDFRKILDERKVTDGLNSWDEILVDAQRRKNRGIEAEENEQKALHLLSPEELNAGFLEQYMIKAKQELDQTLSATQIENESIIATLRQQREEIENLVSGLELLASDVSGAVNVLEEQLENGGEQLRREVWEVENELRSNT